MPDLREKVFKALKNASDNGYEEIFSETPQYIAADLIAYDSDLEDESEEVLIPFIQEWLAQYQGGENA